MGSHAVSRAVFSLIVCVQLWRSAIGTLEDKVPRHTTENFGAGNAVVDPNAKVSDGEQNLLMITEVRIGYYDYNGVRDIRCVSFSYGDEKNPCDSNYATFIDTFILERDEYIIKVAGTKTLSINKITLTTNKRTIGPYGQDQAKDEFTAEYGGAPLLYVKMVYGMLAVYEMTFTFHEYTVNNLQAITDQVATETYDVVTSTILDIFEIQANYLHMLMDVGRKGCYPYQIEQTPEALTACNLQTILQQVNVLASSTTSHLDHSTRNLVPYANYDTEEFVKQVQQAEQFHTLMTQLQFDLNTVIDVTDQQSQDLNNYFSAQAEFDKEIAKQDILYLEGQIDRCEAGAAEASKAVGDRLKTIIDVGISMVVLELTADAVVLGVVIAENCNPFKWIFGGPEIEDIVEATEEFLKDARDLAKLSYLCDYLEEYMQLSTDIANKFAENSEQIAAMNELVDQFATVNDTDELLELSENYIQAYGAYSPQVTEQDVAYMSALLAAVGDEACDILGDLDSMSGSIGGMTYESIAQDCLYLPADQAALDSYYEETYSLQFELVDALTSVVRYSVAEHMAGDIGAVKKTIDVQSATIGTCMLEIQYQASCQVRCDILEYVEAGKRPDVCKNLLFTDNQIMELISYQSSLSKSERDMFAYFPTNNQHGVDMPFIDIEKLLRGGQATLRLPIKNTDWLKTYNWIPGYFDAETGFYVEAIEPFIPGLKCNESSQSNAEIFLNLVSASPQLLYKQPTEPDFAIFQQKVKFSFETNADPCAGEYVEYPIVRNDTTTFQADDKVRVCVSSKGVVTTETRDDYTLPSLYTQWNLTVHSDPGCTLVFKPDFDFHPLLTFKLKIREVMVKADPGDTGIDECWPEGSRCPVEQWCVDEELGYHCQDGKPLVESSMEYAVDLLHDIKNMLYAMMSE